MKAGDLVEIQFGTLADLAFSTAIYLELDCNSSWKEGEEENYSRAMVLWDGDVVSVPIEQIEVINESTA